ncbi:MAG: DUF2730 family protein [Alphaproteobacteria bacterium]
MGWLNYWPIGLFVVNGALGWFIWSMSARFATKRELQAVEAATAELRGRVESLPTATAVHELALTVAKVQGQIERIDAQVDGVEKLVTRVERAVARQEEHLLRSGS